jgi:hypothetical protein
MDPVYFAFVRTKFLDHLVIPGLKIVHHSSLCSYQLQEQKSFI